MRVFSFFIFSFFHFLISSSFLFGQNVSDASNDFCQTEIPDSVWQMMQGKTFRENPYIGRADLRYVRVLHVDKDGHTHRGEMVVNKKIADDVVDIFRQLYEARYPIERMVLPDVYDADDERQMRANNTSAFCYRNVAGTSKLSKHSRGLAIDVNTLYNPYCKVKQNGQRIIQPSNAARYLKRDKKFPYKIMKGDLCYKLFTERGFEWGGEWKTVKDYQHFELKECLEK